MYFTVLYLILNTIPHNGFFIKYREKFFKQVLHRYNEFAQSLRICMYEIFFSNNAILMKKLQNI